jgi:hypothetical protein
MLVFLERFFDRTLTKFILAFLIILSVLPLPEIRRFDLLFFGIFSVELLIRIILLRRARRRSAVDLVMIVVDAVAVLSFLPLPSRLIEARYLRLLRLVRLSLLVRFVASLAKDMWTIVARREIKYQLGFLLGSVVILTFLSGIILHALQMPVDLNNDGVVEQGTLRQVLWWSFLEIESQDNIARNLSGPVAFTVVSILLTLAGVFVMSLLIGLGASVVEQLLSASRSRPVAMTDHVVVIGWSRNLRYLLDELVSMMRKNRQRPSIAILAEDPSPPDYLYEPALRSVEYRGGSTSDLGSLRLVNADEALKTIVLYDDEKRELADAYTISTVLAVREMSQGPIYMELRDDANLKAARDAGGTSILPVPMGRLMGKILCQNLVFPGMDRVFEELLTAKGSDIYTTFFTPGEQSRLAGGGREFDFEDLLLTGYRRNGVILLGVFLGEEGKHQPWVNPMSRARGAGMARGKVPAERLTGLIGVARGKKDLDGLRAVIVEGGGLDRAEAADDVAIDFALSDSLTRLRHVLIMGENEHLPSLLRETTAFAPRAEFSIIIPGKARGELLCHRLAHELGGTMRQEDGRPSLWSFGCLEGAARVNVSCCDENVTGMLADPALWEGRRFDAAVFLSDIGAVDPDAQGLLWLFRVMDLVDRGIIRVSPNFHVVAEIAEAAKGELVEKRFSVGERRRVRAISTSKIRTYFMAQICFGPEVWGVIDELLGSSGEEFCQLALREWEGGTTFTRLLTTFAREGLILLGVGFEKAGPSGPVVLNPRAGTADETIDLGNVKAFFAVGDTETLMRTRGTVTTLPPAPDDPSSPEG